VSSEADDRGIQFYAAVAVLSAVCFNFALAIVNANISLSSRHVIAAEGAIFVFVHILLLRRYRPAMGVWYALMCVLTAIAAARWSWMGHIDPKSLRDTLLIPTFLCLGVVAGTASLNRVFVIVHCLVVAVALVELLTPDLYSAFVNVKQYYISTRGFGEGSFWNQNSDLFVSATRPTERAFFPSLGTYRASSLFLEPVSLGNYCILITAFLCARFSSLGVGTIMFMAVSNLMLVIASDGRLAVVTSAALIIVAMFARLLPYLSVLYLPGAVAIAFAVHGLTGWEEGQDNFTGRVGLTAELLGKMPLSEYLGVGEGGQSFDSGLAYLIQTQTVAGVIILWFFLNFGIREDTPEQARAKHTVLVYIAVTMMVSYSFLTIKTAALAWFFIGAMQAAALSPYAAARLHGTGRSGGTW
jgi:putative polymerase